MTDPDAFEWLVDWYAAQVDGEWEHEFGVAIDTLDNPGWAVRIDLAGTPHRERRFEPVARQDGESWVRCWKDDDTGEYLGAGDQNSLRDLIEIFRDWVDAASSDPRRRRT